MFSTKVRVVKYSDSSFMGRDGKQVPFRNATVLLGTEVLKLGVKDVDLSPFAGKDINVEIAISSDKELKPRLHIVKILQ